VQICNVYSALFYKDDRIKAKLKSSIVYCLISPVLVLLEECFSAINKLKITKSVRDEIAKKAWGDMTEEEKQKMVQYYRFHEYENERKLQFMAREASIQLIIQQAFVLYQFVYTPMRELEYSAIGHLTPFAIWILRLAVQLISILLSAYSTFNPILSNIKFQTFKKEQEHASVFSYVLTILQMSIHIIYATGVVYLL